MFAEVFHVLLVVTELLEGLISVDIVERVRGLQDELVLEFAGFLEEFVQFTDSLIVHLFGDLLVTHLHVLEHHCEVIPDFP